MNLVHSKLYEKKLFNYKIIDIVEYYNFDIDFVSIRDCQPSQIQYESLY
jgi:hypothetical protein